MGIVRELRVLSVQGFRLSRPRSAILSFQKKGKPLRVFNFSAGTAAVDDPC